MARALIRHGVTIPNAGTEQVLAESVDLRENTLLGIEIPAGFDGTSIKFQGTSAGGTGSDAPAEADYLAVYDSSGTEVNLTVAASRYVALTPAHAQALAGLSRVKVVVGSQTGAVTIYLVVIPNA